VVPAFHVDPTLHALHMPFAEAVAGVKPLPAVHDDTVTAPHPFALVPAFHVDPTLHALHTPFAEAVAGVKPLPAVHDVTVTAPHPFALVPAFHVDPATQLVHTPFADVVAGVSPLPVVHVLVVTAAHGFPFVPAFHVDPATQLVHTPFADVVPGVSPRPAEQLVRWFAQLVARTPDEYFPAPQVLHTPSPYAAYFPAVHPVLVDVPAHLYPAVHKLQCVRVVEQLEQLPADVNLVLAHVKHELADAALYLKSFPHIVQPPEPAVE
jgi:hypothetical protein